MDAATLAHAQEPFFTTKPLGKGTGLGLSMAKGFAVQSGGGMALSSVPGAGTTVSLWLCRAEAAVVPSPDVPDAAAGDAGPPADVQGAHVLLVDDDTAVRETMEAQLDDLGFAVRAASSGAEALALLAAGEPVDALVCDLSMPDMNGMDTIAQARVMRPGLPCFLLTGYMGDRAMLAADGAFTLLRKPVLGRVLAANIAHSLAGDSRESLAI